MSTLINLDSKVNAMHPTYAKKLGFVIWKINVKAQKIDGTILKNFGIVIAAFSVDNRAKKICFFEKTFLLDNISMNVALGMFFFILSNADVYFTNWRLYWRFYTVTKALQTTHCVEFINQKEFAIAALGENDKVFVVHMVSLAIGSKISIHPSWAAQLTSLIADEAPVAVPTEYSNFADLFSSKSAAELSKHTKINNHPIKLIYGQQPAYEPIYNIRPVELETLKTYIKTNLAIGVIRPFKSPTRAFILFIQKFNGNLQLCVNYQCFNNLTIRNQYPFPLIGKLLDYLS